MNNAAFRDRPLPFQKVTAWAYDALDLPYGAPLDQVTRQWQAYLKKCNPALYQNDADLLDTAQKLTKILSHAHRRILEAWEIRVRLESNRPLPYQEEVDWAYEALDLPYGAPLAQATGRWKKYIKQCHPDLHGQNPEMEGPANTLTRLLTEAHDRIKQAWEVHGG